MSTITDLVDRYLASWNETDARRRRELIAAVWAENASYVDPLMTSDGHDGIDAMIAAVQARFPAHRFSRLGTIDAHNDRLRFGWELTPEGGEPIAAGTDFAVVANGRLQSVTGFLDRVPNMD
ncbi:MAG: nuclear transport factor 2 family protein [Alphaproteobacteria bacterium]|nr:nuclear transport factor 2 family protein [Alphaproteobacteria bacterium]